MPIHCLFDARTSSDSKLREGSLVDVVAVHDAHESNDTAWTDPVSRTNWLEKLPEDLVVGRIVLYGYEEPVDSFFGPDAHERTQRMAESLVQELRADRQFTGTQRQPIIFICHGLGGVLVKKSLVYSSTRTAPKVAHLRDLFVSTFAILFFGTPHGKSYRSAWLPLENSSNAKHSLLRSDPHRLSAAENGILQVSQTVDNDFGPLTKRFRLFFFWEELPTSVGSHSKYVVDTSLAAPRLDNTEAAGIPADHSGMVKFPSVTSSTYRTVLAALTAYSEKAPEIVAHRWEEADSVLRHMRAGEIWELTGFRLDVPLEQPYHDEIFRSSPASQRYFYPPQSKASNFVSRHDLLDELGQAFFPQESASEAGVARKPLVVFGMGGSGKTMLCSEYANMFKHKYSAVFTILAASKQTVTDSYSTIGQIVGSEATEVAGRHLLSQLTDTWLLIIDNVEDPDFDLVSLFPPGDAAHVLISTRCRSFCNNKALQSIHVQGLTKDDALHLLLTTADVSSPWDDSTKEEGDRITASLGYLALAVVQAGNCIFRGVCKLSEYLDLHAGERLLTRRKPPFANGTAAGAPESEALDSKLNPVFLEAIYATFDPSLNVLLSRPMRQRQDALDLLKILSFLHLEDIPVEMFSRAAENRTRGMEQPRQLSYAERFIRALLSRLEPPKLLPGFLKSDSGKLDWHRVNWAISELWTLSLINFDGRYITLHPMIREWAQSDLTPGEKKVWASVALDALFESISLPSVGHAGSDIEYYRNILPHLERCLPEPGSLLSWLASNASWVPFQASTLLRPTMMLIFWDQVQKAAKSGFVLAEMGIFDRASKHLEEVKGALARLLGEQHEKRLITSPGLAAVLWGSGKPDEIVTLQRAVLDYQTHISGAVRQQQNVQK